MCILCNEFCELGEESIQIQICVSGFNLVCAIYILSEISNQMYDYSSLIKLFYFISG